MADFTDLAKFVQPSTFLASAAKAATIADIDKLLASLPIVSEHDYSYDETNPTHGWQPGKFHWMPVGRDRGNAGRIKQANHPVNPIAERTINGMEAIIELARQKELVQAPNSPDPGSPREAVKRYFGLPPLDELPKLDNSPASKLTRTCARELARQLRVRLAFDKPSREF